MLDQMSTDERSMRGTALLLALAIVPPSEAGEVLRLLGVRPPDPEIRSLESYLTEPIRLDEARICVFPFGVAQAGQPAAPSMVEPFVEAIEFHLPDATVLPMASRPGVDVPAWQRATLDVVQEMANSARMAGCDLFLDGVQHRTYRKPSGGYRIRAAAALYAVEPKGAALRWRGRKSIDWRLRQTTEECLLLFAEQVVFDWLDLAPVPVPRDGRGDGEPEECDDATIEDSSPCPDPNSTPKTSSPARPRFASSSWTATAY